MSKRRVVILGATGFIGRNMAETLASNEALEVIGVHNRRPPYQHSAVTWVQADLTDQGDVERCLEGADIVVQAAATTSGSKDTTSRPHIHVTDNAVMNSLILRSAFEHNVRHLVFFSCSVMYPSGVKPVREEDFSDGQDIHPTYFGAAWTKVYIERMCEFYAGLGRTRFTVIRHSNIYGPHDKFDLERSHVMGATITKVLTAKDGKILVWGSGEEARDLLYVSDLVDFVGAAIEKQETPIEILNAGSGSAVGIKDLVAKVIEASGRDLRIEHDLSKPTIPTSLSLDCTKARAMLGWEPAVSLGDGIARTIDWWRKHPPL